jgi:hypothetical protein
MTTKKPAGRRRKIVITALSIIAVLIAIRLALPYVVLHYANKSLSTMDGFRGHINDIDIALIRGAYQLDSIYLNKIDSVTLRETPFFSASLVDLSVEWRALLKGSLVGEMKFINPILRFTRDKVEPDDVRKDSSELKELREDFMPLKVNRFEVENGTITYIDENSHPRVDVSLTNAHILATNLRNSYDSVGEILPATIKGTATVYEGDLSFNMKINPLADVPTFDINAELNNTNLVKLNDFFKAYAKADVNKGTFGLYTEIAAKEGKFKGYVKPLIKDLKVLGPEDRKDNIFKKLWEGLVGTAGEVFENQPKERLATKIPFEGNVENPKANAWYAIVQVLQNAFVRALQPSLDQEINIATVDDGSTNRKRSAAGNDKKDKKQLRADNRKKKRDERRERRADKKKKKEESKS